MGYSLGIDLGTTYTAAAKQHSDVVEILHLGERAPAAASVIFIGEDGSSACGDAADRQALVHPERVAREFKRRVGDPTPIVLGDTAYPPENLLAHMLDWTYRTVVTSEGVAPDRVALTHPANWGDFKQALLREAARRVGLSDVMTLSEPEAAAVSYASQERVEPGSVLAVYDLGGGTFDAAVLRKDAHGFSLLGRPEGIERLGGVDVDAAVFSHVAAATGGALEELDPDDADAMAAVLRLRQECVAAKEALSADTEIAVPVLLPNLSTEIRLTRVELETMIRGPLTETVSALRRALRSATVDPESLRSVLLVGGSSRIPLVAQLVSAELGRPVAVDAHPKHAIALGAAISASADPERFAVTTEAVMAAPPPSPPPPPSEPPARPQPSPPPEPTMSETTPPGPPDPNQPQPPPPGAGAPPPRSAIPPPGTGAPPPRSLPETAPKGRRALIIILVILTVVALAVVVLFVLAMNQSDEEESVPLDESEVGECFDRIDGGFADLGIVDCADPHDGQLFAIVSSSSADSDTYPGDSALEEEAGPACQEQLVSFYGAPVEDAVADGIDFVPLVPSEQAWTEDQIHEARCVAIDAGGEKLTGTLKGAGG